jgi:hypothetical protein
MIQADNPSTAPVLSLEILGLFARVGGTLPDRLAKSVLRFWKEDFLAGHRREPCAPTLRKNAKEWASRTTW